MIDVCAPFYAYLLATTQPADPPPTTIKSYVLSIAWNCATRPVFLDLLLAMAFMRIMNTVAKLRLSTRHMPGISIDVMSEGSVLFMLADRAGSVMLVGIAGSVMLAAMARAVVLVADDARTPPLLGLPK